MNDKLNEAIETLGRLKHYIQTDVNRYGGGWDSIVEAIDTVVAELEPINHKELTCDHNWKEWEDENCNAQMRCTKCKSIRKW